MKRGDVYWADLGPARASAPAYRRPLVIVQCDPANRSELATIICVVMTSNLALGKLPGNVTVESAESGLPKDSIVNVSQVVTVNKADLELRTGRLSRRTMDRIDGGLRRMLELW